MIKGFDSAVPVDHISNTINVAGISFVARYYSHNPRKNLSLKEAQALSNNKINLVTVWEAVGDKATSFSSEMGTSDAHDALICAAKVQQPSGAIYFAVDFDVTRTKWGRSTLNNRIIPYFKSVSNVLKDKFEIGVYGNGYVCSTLLSKKLVTKTWLAGAMGWTDSRIFVDWNIRQGFPSDPYHIGFNIDPDEAVGDDYGQWILPSQVIDITRRTLQLTTPFLDGDDVYQAQILISNSGITITIDGLFGPETKECVIKFQTKNKLKPDGLIGPITWNCLDKYK